MNINPFFLVIRNWLSTAKMVCPSKEAEEFSLDKLDGEIAKLEEELSSKEEKIAFCHNDLQYGNIMMDEETGIVTMIVSSLCLTNA
jgi:choline/ethanolamine kinase